MPKRDVAIWRLLWPSSLMVNSGSISNSDSDAWRELDNTPDSTENYIFKTYGRGIMDADR
jgi:hypothetical protein